jgi:hypothetical protein
MFLHKKPFVSFFVAVALVAPGFAAGQEGDKHSGKEPWRGLHLINYGTDQKLETLARQVPQLAGMGVNVLIVEINYNFDFKSHAELRGGTSVITRDGAGKLAAVCKKHGVRLIPEFQSLGHQSWGTHTSPLLTAYPELDLTPGAFPGNKGVVKGMDHGKFYCREWDPLNPKVNEIVFKLMDEIIDAFQADALHVGMDEVFLLGSEYSPSTKGKPPGDVFAKAVTDLHGHLANERHVEMLMWADRLFDANQFHWDEWEASKVGTAAALDKIPKDIILCPWHYNLKPSYPSIPLFLEKGFRVLPASWHKPDASLALIDYSLKLKSPRMLGHLFTTWGRGRGDLTKYPSLVEGLKKLK